MNEPSLPEESIFAQALELESAGERAAYLDRACGEDRRLRAEVEALLRAHEKSGDLLDLPEQAVATVDAPLSECPGTVIGPYKLLEQIGEGGFGVVYMAEQQQPLRRKVALKVLKPGMDTRQVVARFEAERQALALMDHPNIAHVFDGGETVSGRPYFVMDLVKGIPITEFCDQSQLTPRERLELFIHVCQAIQHAHQKGIIHRDVKPTNVLVTMQDGAPLVRVIDFGIAKALGQQLTDKTLFTGFAQMIGSPLYMSPEQAALSNVDVDTRSDVYSLGVLLYELLTGTTPFDKERLKEVGYDEMRRIIREEEPPKPSTRMSTLGLAPTTVSTQRRSNPKQLSRLFRGELDWIVMKCLEKDRDRRYETASALAADVERYLHDQPVLACPPSAAYRFRKFFRRNKGPVLAAFVVLLALVLGVNGTTWGLIRARYARRGEEQQRFAAQANADEADRQRQLAQANLQLARKAVDDLYQQVVGEFNNPGRNDYHLGLKFQQQTLAFYQELARLQETDPALRLGVARAQIRVAEIHYNFSLIARAEDAVTQAIARLDELKAERPDDPSPKRELAKACHFLGMVLTRTHRKAAAEPVLRRAIGLLSSPPVKSTAHPADRYLLAGAYLDLGMVLLHNLAVAEEAIRTGIELTDRLVADWPSAIKYRDLQVIAHRDLGDVQAAGHHYQEAEASYREALDLLGHDAAEWIRWGHFTSIHLRLARVLEATGRPNDAHEACRQAVEVLEPIAREARLDTYSWNLLTEGYGQLARLAARAGRADEVAACHNRALDSLDRFVDKLPAEEAYEDLALAIFASFSGSLGLPGERLDWEPLYRRTLVAAERLVAKFPGRPGPQSLVAHWHASLGSILTARSRPAEAADEYRQALGGYRAVLDLDPNRLSTLNNLAWLLATCPEPKLRDVGRAVELARKATELAPQYGYLWNTRGVAHYRAGDWEAARAGLEKSLALYAGRPEHTTLESFSTFFLAMAHARLGHAAEARRWYDRAARWMDHYQPDDLELRRFRAEVEELLKAKQEN